MAEEGTSGGLPIFALTTPQWRSYSLSGALRGHSSWARFVTGEFGGAIRGAFGRIQGCVRSDQVEPVRVSVGQQPTISMADDPD